MQVQLETLNEPLEEPTIPKEYRDLANVFLPSNANFPRPHRDEDHVIELEPGKTPPFGPLYNLSEYELKTLREYIDKNLANRFIRPSKSSAGAPVLFTLKPDATLRLFVDYRWLADLFAIKVTKRLANRKLNSDLNIDLWGELLYKGSVLYISEDKAHRMEILKEYHDDPFAGHLATKRIYNTLLHKYFWPNMYKKMKAYYISCLICQRASVICEKQPGKLQPLPISTKV